MGFCGLQTAGAQLNCFRSLLIIKSDFSNNKYSLFLGTPTSGHPNLCTSKHYFVTEIEFVRNRPKRADVPIWRKSDLSRIDHRWHMSQKVQRGTSGQTLKHQYLALRAKPLSPAATCEAWGRSHHPASLLSWTLALCSLKRVIFFSAVFFLFIVS